MERERERERESNEQTHADAMGAADVSLAALLLLLPQASVCPSPLVRPISPLSVPPLLGAAGRGHGRLSAAACVCVCVCVRVRVSV